MKIIAQHDPLDAVLPQIERAVVAVSARWAGPPPVTAIKLSRIMGVAEAGNENDVWEEYLQVEFVPIPGCTSTLGRFVGMLTEAIQAEVEGAKVGLYYRDNGDDFEESFLRVTFEAESLPRPCLA